MSKILITGGSGFIGTNIIEKLTSEGETILNIDILPPQIKEQLSLYKKADICDYEKLEKLVEDFNPDYVIHLAARTDLNGINQEDYSANIKGVENILRILDKLSNLKRVIFTSSMYVCKPGYIPDGYEDYQPHTEYGKSKVQTEEIIKKHNPKYAWCIIRPTSIWGPYFGEPYNLFFKIVLSRKYFHMGKRACKKTYGYIDNTVYQILSLLNTDKKDISRKVFYLGDYNPYDITEWANEIGEIANLKIPQIPFFIFRLAGWFGDFLKIWGIKFPMTSFRLKNMTTNNIHDLTLIQTIAPELPVNRIEGTKKTINWIRENQL